MASGGFPPNPYDQGFPHQRGNTPPMYRSQQPRFQRSPRPRFHQQYIPHYGGPSPRGPSPRGPSPRGERFQGRPWQPRFPEGHRPQWTPSPRRDSGPYRGRGGRHGGNVDCNPGGSDDISQYYSPSMVEDPWAGMKPVPLTEHSNFTT